MAGVRRVGKLMIPGTVGGSMAQVSLLPDTLTASFHAIGSIAWPYNADRLMELPLGVFNIALASVILPGLCAHHAAESTGGLSETPDWALRLTVLLATPAAVGLLLLGFPAPHVQLATSICFGAAINTVLPWRWRVQAGECRPSPVWPRFPLRVVLAEATMAPALYPVSGDLDSWAAMRVLERVVRRAAGILAAAAVYSGVLYAAGMRYRDLRTGL